MSVLAINPLFPSMSLMAASSGSHAALVPSFGHAEFPPNLGLSDLDPISPLKFMSVAPGVVDGILSEGEGFTPEILYRESRLFSGSASVNWALTAEAMKRQRAIAVVASLPSLGRIINGISFTVVATYLGVCLIESMPLRLLGTLMLGASLAGFTLETHSQRSVQARPIPQCDLIVSLIEHGASAADIMLLAARLLHDPTFQDQQNSVLPAQMEQLSDVLLMDAVDAYYQDAMDGDRRALESLRKIYLYTGERYAADCLKELGDHAWIQQETFDEQQMDRAFDGVELATQAVFVKLRESARYRKGFKQYLLDHCIMLLEIRGDYRRYSDLKLVALYTILESVRESPYYQAGFADDMFDAEALAYMKQIYEVQVGNPQLSSLQLAEAK